MKQTRRNALELARHLMVSVLAFLIALGPAGLAFGNPKGAVVVKGSATFTNEGSNVFVIDTKNGTIIKYKGFDIAGGETVRFQPLPGASGLIRVLNRIDSKAPTKIDGTIAQQGGTFMIYIVNPAGVFFGADSKINVTGLQAAAGNLSDRDFERSRDHFTNLKGKVENAGKIGVDPSTIPETDPNQISTNEIVTNAVSLVGREVLNSGNIDANGWIVMAAGKDVFIGRDTNGNGLLLRVEGGADAVFKKSAKGVTNTGSLNVASIANPATTTDGVTTQHPSAPAGRISLGAGDLYGTAIFNRGAIKAREIALQASNQGNVALAGEVEASTVGITFGGDKAGKLIGATDAPQTLKADTLNLTATGEKGQVVVGDRFVVQRATTPAPEDEATATTSVNVEQKAVLTTSNLANLDIHSQNDPAKTLVDLKSTAGILVDDRKLVAGTRLTLDAPATLIQGPRDPLVVEELNLQSRFVQTESDLIATGGDQSRFENDPNDSTKQIEVFDPAMRMTGNLQIVTKAGGAGGATNGTLLSAAKGTISTVGDIITTDGGGLIIRAGDVRLGTRNADGTLTGGSIANSGSRTARVTIVADNQEHPKDQPAVLISPHLLGSVQANSITTQAGVTVPGVDQALGGDVTITALGVVPGNAADIPTGTAPKDYGNLALFGDVTTQGGAPLVAGNPQHDGGSVRLVARQTLTVRNIITGGAEKDPRTETDPDAPGENGSILLAGGNVVLAGNLDASGGTVRNANGERNRRVMVVAPGSVTLGADNVKITGGDVEVQGSIVEGMKQDPNHPDDPNALVQREVALSFDANRLVLRRNPQSQLSGVDVKSLDILARSPLSPDPSTSGGVLFDGIVSADDFVHVKFDTANGLVRWGTAIQVDEDGKPVLDNDGLPVFTSATVKAPEISVTANQPDGSLEAGGAKVVFDPNLHFDLPELSSEANDPHPQFSLWQSGAIDKATTDNLLTADRFVGVGGLTNRTLLLRTNSTLTLDETALPDVKGTDLKLIGNHFVLAASSPEARKIDVASLELTTFGNLDANFEVNASGTRDDQGIGLHAGATGVGDLNVSGQLHGHSILLVAGDGTEIAEGGATGALVKVSSAARFTNTDPNAAPEVFGIQQDASIATGGEGFLPGKTQFGGSVAGMEYRLESADGDVSLQSGAAAYFEGTNLFLNGQTGVDLGSEALTLAGLAAQTRGSMAVSTPVTVNEPNGVIDLSAGESGVGQLTIGAKLTADNIDLRAAGVGDAAGGNTANVVLGDGASFAGASGIPKHFGMIQDASLDQSELPTLGDFAADSLAGMDLELRSLGGTLSLTNPALVEDTKLALEGHTGVNIAGTLALDSLDAKGPLTTNGSIETTHDLSVDTTIDDIAGVVRLTGAGAASAPLNQSLEAGGVLTVTGKINKSSGGDVVLGSGVDSALTVGDVATAHTGGHIDIHAGGDAVIGALDASGTGLDRDVTAVKVEGDGKVEIAGINARGKNGLTNAAGSSGGGVEVRGTALRLGTVDSSGGNGGFANGATPTAGGNAGAIELADITPGDGTPIQISILGDLLAAGGVGSVPVTTPPTLPSHGEANDVTVGGALLLLAKAEDGPTNKIVGRNVEIDGTVGPGVEKLTADAEETAIPGSATGLTVVADESLSITGDTITAGLLDLEVHTGDLALGTKTINSDRIRLAATDGAGGHQTGSVENVDQLTFKGADVEDLDDPNIGTQRRIQSLTIEQDAGFGGPGDSPIPNVNDQTQFGGRVPDKFPAIALGLISQDETITLGAEDFDKVKGSRLTLAANSKPNEPRPIQIDGGADGELSLQSLQLGNALGVGGGVGGDADVSMKKLTVGDPNAPSNDALRTFGDLTVTGDASVLGTTRFSGANPNGQVLHVTGKLELAGADVIKSTEGDLAISATQGIDLTATTAQTISNEGGRLVIDGPLIKGTFVKDSQGNNVDLDGDGNPDPVKESSVGQRGLSLHGISQDPNQAAVVVTGTTSLLPKDPNGPDPHEYAIAIANGDLFIGASQRAPGSSTTSLGKYELGGDVLAFGDITLAGQGSFHGKSSYTVEAQRNPHALAGDVLSGELTMGGISSADGDLKLIAAGDDPSFDIAHPAAIHLDGNFRQLAGDLEIDGSLDLADDTTISAAGDVRFDDRIQGEKGLSVATKGQVVLFDDVALTGGALSLSGDKGVRFASTSDTQLVQAGSISLGSDAARTPSGAATVVRDGNLSLAASGGDVAVANGQRMVVNGSLSVSAKRRISLTDTAALRIKLVSQDLVVRSGATLVANSIVSTASPRVTGGGVATFAVPTRTEVTDNIPSDQILLRQINADGSPLSLASSFPEGVEFPTVPFPAVSGPAQFDYAAQTPQPPLRQPQTRPHVDVKELDASLANRPLWAEELLAYLEQRSVETPGVAEAVEHLPPVGARPGDPLAAEDRRVRGAAAERAVALYRELFRPDVARNPETGFIDEPARMAAIRAAFQQPIDALRRENGGKPVSGTALRDLISSTPSFAPAQGYGAQLGQLVAAGELALTPDQKPRWTGLVLSDVTPYGIAPAEFATAIR